ALGGNARMGSNLMAHLRSDITGQIPRSALPGLGLKPTDMEVAALLVRGETADKHQYHFQVTASAGPTSDSFLFASVPDLDLQDKLRASQNPSVIAITLRAIGEMVGDPTAKPGDQKKSWVDLALQSDPRTSTRRAWVNLEPTDADNTAWTDMETAARNLLTA